MGKNFCITNDSSGAEYFEQNNLKILLKKYVVVSNIYIPQLMFCIAYLDQEDADVMSKKVLRGQTKCSSCISVLHITMYKYVL